jgi:oxygen-independent coproporphyrinogen-3 oxidase
MPTTGSIYVHVPFCRKKCPYCHFYVAPDHDDLKRLLLRSLALEWTRKAPLLENTDIVSIYFGGGTPALFGPDAIGEVLKWIQPSPTCEITLEANPGEVTFDLLRAFAQAGINRLSIGVQSFDDALLKVLGRTHTGDQAATAVLLAKEAGIDNISIDLMYDIPHQTLAQWRETLQRCTTLPLTHLSLYNLTFEEGTPFFRKQKLLIPTLPSPEASLAMLQEGTLFFPTMGLHRYEISAFAAPGYASRHNTGYWTFRPFLGFGPSAFGDWDGKRERNVANLKQYADLLDRGLSPVDFTETLDPLPRLHEKLAIGLRLLEGVRLDDFPIDPALYKRLEERGFLKREAGRARLTEQGRLFYDSVATEIVI